MPRLLSWWSVLWQEKLSQGLVDPFFRLYRHTASPSLRGGSCYTSHVCTTSLVCVGFLDQRFASHSSFSETINKTRTTAIAIYSTTHLVLRILNDGLISHTTPLTALACSQSSEMEGDGPFPIAQVKAVAHLARWLAEQSVAHLADQVITKVANSWTLQLLSLLYNVNALISWCHFPPISWCQPNHGCHWFILVFVN